MRRINPGRFAALLYLLASATGFFSYMYVKPALTVYRDAAATAGLIIAQIFWGLWLLPLGMLVRRSGFVPRILGTLLIFNGIAYPATTLIWLLLPAYTTTVFRIALIPELGEGFFIFWLLIKGVP